MGRVVRMVTGRPVPVCCRLSVPLAPDVQAQRRPRRQAKETRERTAERNGLKAFPHATHSLLRRVTGRAEALELHALPLYRITLV